MANLAPTLLLQRVLPKPNMNNQYHNHHFADTEVVDQFPLCLKGSRSSFTSTIKGVFYNFRAFRRTLSNYAKPKEAEVEEEGSSNNNNNNEEEIVVSEIRARAIEARLKRNTSFIQMSGDSFRRIILSFTGPAQGDLCLPPVAAWAAALQNKGEEEFEEEFDDDFFSVRSYLSCASTARSGEEFVSMRTNFTRSKSLSGIDDRQFIVLQELWREEDVRRRMIIKEIIHCDGWPFGLFRKALLLPPLPKSPAESWKWRNSGKLIRAP